MGDAKHSQDCASARALASREFDRPLAPSDRAALDKHLDGCSPCRRARSAEAQVDGLLTDALPADFFGETFARGVAEAVRAAATPKPTRAALLGPSRLGPRALVAAVAAVFFAVAFSLGRSPDVAPPARYVVPIARASGGGIRVDRVRDVSPPDGAGPRIVAVRPLDARDDLEGIEVLPGERIVNVGGTGALVFADGTRIDLRPDTTATLRADADGGVTVVLGPTGGEVFCEVAKRSKPFRVAAGPLVATVLGTRFVVRAGGDDASVAVVEGRVRVSASSGEVVVAAAQEAVVHGISTLVARPFDAPRGRLAWCARALEALPADRAGPSSGPRVAPAPGPRVGPVPGVAPDATLDQPVK